MAIIGIGPRKLRDFYTVQVISISMEPPVPHDGGEKKKENEKIQNTRRKRGVYNGVKPYQCDLCWKSFSRKWYLEIHQSVHGGKRYQCDLCL